MLYYRNAPVATCAAAAALRTLLEFNQQELALTAWAISKLPFPNRPVLDAGFACHAAPGQRMALGPQFQANMPWSVATIAFVDEPLLPAIAAGAGLGLHT